MKSDLLTTILKIVKYRFNLQDGKAEESDIVEGIKKTVEFKGLNLWTLIFAIFIASIGLNVNSTAVIIGAMLISPLMGPIMGIGLGFAIYDFELIKKSIKNILFATVIALVTSSIYFLLSPLNDAKSELLARTNPTIWDVLIALFGGLTGIIAGSRKSISNAIPGVAIATALMPPLCTAGYGLAVGNFSYLFGAFYLYLINCFFISISTYLVIRFLKFNPVEIIDINKKNRIKKSIITAVVILVLPTIYFAYTMVKQELFVKRANKFINMEIIADSLYVLTKKIDPVVQKIDLLIYGANLMDANIHILENKKSKYDLNSATINIENAKSDENFNQKDYSTIVENVITNNKNIIYHKDSIINKYKETEAMQNALKLDEKNIKKEFNTLFCATKNFSLSKTFILNDSSKIIDTIAVLYVKPIQKSVKLFPQKIEEWLEVRTKTDNVKVIIERE